MSEPIPASPNSDASPRSSRRSQKLNKLEIKVRAMYSNLPIKASPIINFYPLQSKKTFILTPSHFVLAKKNFKAKSNDPFIFPWNKLVNIVIGPKVVNVYFDDSTRVKPDEKFDFKLKFEKSEYNDAVTQLCDTLQTMLLPSELKNLNFEGFQKNNLVRGPGAAKYRLMMYPEYLSLNPETVKLIDDFIKFSPDYVDLAEIKETSACVPMFFDILPFLPNIHTVRVPNLKDLMIFELATKLVRNTTTIKSLDISGNCKDTLPAFIAAIKESSQNSQLTSISFGLTKVSIKDLDLIGDIIANGNINSIGFHSAFKDDSESYFYSSFFSPSVTEKLIALNLDNTVNIDLGKLFPTFRKIAILSLAGCGLNIANVFHMLTLNCNTLNQLQMINLSGNTFAYNEFEKTKFPQKKSKMPPRLRNFILNDITWPEKTFRHFFEYLFTHVHGKLKLSVSSAITTAREWKNVFNFLGSTSFSNLYELTWNDNSLHQDFFKFLSRNKKLVRLQMDGCFNEADTSLIDELCDYISDANALQALILCGHNLQYFGKQLPRVISAASKMRHLRFFDIGNNHAGEQEEFDQEKEKKDLTEIDENAKVVENKECEEESLKLIKDLANNSKGLEFLNYDGILPCRQEPYISVLKDISRLQNKIKFSYPANDMKRLQSRQIVSAEINESLEILYKHNLPEENPTNGIALLNLPSSVYKHNGWNIFPSYVTIKMQNQVARKSRPISIPEGEIEDNLIYDPDHDISEFSEGDEALNEAQSEPSKSLSESSDHASNEDGLVYNKGRRRFESAKFPVPPVLKKPQKKPMQAVKERDIKIDENERSEDSDNNGSSSNDEPPNKQTENKSESESESTTSSSSREELRKKQEKKNNAINNKEDEEAQSQESYKSSDNEKSESSDSLSDRKAEKSQKKKNDDSSSQKESSKQKSKKNNDSSSSSEGLRAKKQSKKQKQAEDNDSSNDGSRKKKSFKGFSDESGTELLSKIPNSSFLDGSKSGQSAKINDFNLEEPEYDFPDIIDLTYPINWEEIDQSVSLEKYYDQISSERRSKLMKHFK